MGLVRLSYIHNSPLCSGMHPSRPFRHPRTVLHFGQAGIPVSLAVVASTSGCADLLNFEDVTIGLPDSIDASRLRDLVVHDGGRVTLKDGAVPEDWAQYLGLEGGAAAIAGLRGKGIGETCSTEEDDDGGCRSGLRCEAGVCVVAGDLETGALCIVSAECAGGQCVQSKCVAPGLGQADEACGGSQDCAPGLRCGTVGLKPICMADGQLDVGQECAHVNDCHAGLSCVMDGEGAICAPTGVTDLVSGAWEGVECDDGADQPLSAYFELPETILANQYDYFRLPFPNTLRTNDIGAIELSDFPTPGVNPLVGVDPIAPYVARVNGLVGWSASSAVQFRFSGEIDFASLGAPGAVQWVDITDPSNPIGAGLGYRFNPGRTAYICKNGLSFRRNDVDPMLPGHTYAVWLSTAVTGLAGAPITRSPTFAALLGDTVPADPALTSAYGKYAAFREYLSQVEVSPDTVLNATVFTIAEPASVMAALAENAATQPVPSASAWVKCETGVASPCPQAEEGRGCESNAAVDEYHALIDLPILSAGRPPYQVIGGDVQNTPVRREAVCEFDRPQATFGRSIAPRRLHSWYRRLFPQSRAERRCSFSRQHHRRRTNGPVRGVGVRPGSARAASWRFDRVTRQLVLQLPEPRRLARQPVTGCYRSHWCDRVRPNLDQRELTHRRRPNQGDRLWTLAGFDARVVVTTVSFSTYQRRY